LALLSALLIEYIDETLKTPDDVARILKLAVVGTIPRIGGSDPARLVAARHPRSLHSEAYRVLRTNVQVADVDSPIKTLLVTSSKPFEGKSVTAANLAVVMAQAGMRVVLIDADMRRPVQAEIFGVPNDTGLTNLLLQADPCLDGYARSVDVENLLVLTTGHLPPNPAELLASKRMERLLERLKDQVDIILLDLPPCLPVADPTILVRKVDGVLLVVEAGKTRRDAAMKAKERLERAGGRIVGVVLNRVSTHENVYDYRYYSQDHQRHRKSGSRWLRLAQFFRKNTHPESRTDYGRKSA
jgi:non-specific protein-tyrosine kinase